MQEAIDEAKSLHLKGDALKTERDCYVYRSYIALGQPKSVSCGLCTLTIE
jgi:hypothetical protein